MNVPKAVITAAGPKQRNLPLQTIADSEGRNRNTLGLLIDEVKSAGIEKLGIVIAPGTESLYRDAAAEETNIDITFIEQSEPRGYGHAVLTAADFTGDDAFLLVVSDHLYVSELRRPELRRPARRQPRPARGVPGVRRTGDPRERTLSYFGAIGGTPFEGRRGSFFEVERCARETVADRRRTGASSPPACATATTCASSACTC